MQTAPQRAAADRSNQTALLDLLNQITGAPARQRQTIGNIELNENMEVASPRSTLPYSAQPTSHVGHPRVGCLQLSSHTPPRDSRPSAPPLSSTSLGETA